MRIVAYCLVAPSHHPHQSWCIVSDTIMISFQWCRKLARSQYMQWNSYMKILFISLTHLPLVPHICVIELVSICSHDGLSPVRRQAVTRANGDLLSIGPWEQTSVRFEIKISICNPWNCDKKSVCEMAAILSGLRWVNTGMILGLRPANERRRYKVTPSLIGWVQTQPLNLTRE